jgi:hypothetical protein
MNQNDEQAARDIARDNIEIPTEARPMPPPQPPPAGPRNDDFDPLAPENLRLDPSYLNEPVAKKLLVAVPVKKPHKQHFIRVHPSPEYRQLAALVELDEDRENYLVLPALVRELGESEYVYATLHLYVTRHGTVGIWPLKVPNSNGRQNLWHTTAIAAAEEAKKKWIRVVPNQVSKSNDVLVALENLSEPEFPELSFNQILRIAFKDRIIDNLHHPVIRKLRGME